VIVTIDLEFFDAVRSDPSWASVKAVRDNRVHLSPKMPFGWVDFPPGINRLIGLWWLAKILYPEHFPEDLRLLTRDFYARFYRVDSKQRTDRPGARGARLMTIVGLSSRRSPVPASRLRSASWIGGLLAAFTVGRYPLVLATLSMC
jgi:hypothetical protein